MKRALPFILILVCHIVSYAQVGIGTDSPSPRSILDISSNNKGLLIPRMTALDRTTLLQPTLTTQDIGMMVFQTSPVKGLFIYQGLISGQHKWTCMPVATDGDPQGATLRWDGTGWVNTVDLYFNNNPNDKRIGLFTVNPQSQLHMYGSGLTTQFQITDFATGSNAGDGLALGLVWETGVGFLNQRENKPLTLSTNNTERIRIDSDGEVGINQSNPQAKLDVNGNFKLGSSGAVLTNILRQPIPIDIPLLGTMTSSLVSVTFPNAIVSGTVLVTPENSLNDIMIAYSRVSSNGNLEIKFINTGLEYNPPLMTFYVTVIQ